MGLLFVEILVDIQYFFYLVEYVGIFDDLFELYVQWYFVLVCGFFGQICDWVVWFGVVEEFGYLLQLLQCFFVCGGCVVGVVC